jgi:hypothetical protein
VSQRNSPVDNLQLLSVPRHQLMAGLYVVGTVNGLAAGVYQSLQRLSFVEATFNLFDVNIVVLFAAAVGFRLAWRSCDQGIRGMDLVVAAVFAAMIAVPDSRVSWIALSLLALYNMICDRRCTYTVAAATVIGALSFHEVWARMIKNVFAIPLTHLDTALVGGAFELMQQEVSWNGNIIITGNNFALLILESCASFSNASLGVLCWVSITRLVRPRWKHSEWLTVLAIVACIVGLNVIRMVLMGMGGQIYETVHNPSGADAFNLLILTVSMLLSVLGVRREIWANRSRSQSLVSSSWKRGGQDKSA